VWCLSNDLSELAKKLRDRFKLGRYFRGFVISGDVGLRKPDARIFQHLLRLLDVSASYAVFVDDNTKNLEAASKLGFKTILFNTGGGYISRSRYKSIKDFSELLYRL
jgi:HAD superfamily hydrolase (TIGR01549 family)